MWIEWKAGATRQVLLVGKYAVKLPRCSHWRAFLNGLLANDQEAAFSRLNCSALCPVVFALSGGFVLVMRRARPLTPFEYIALDRNWAGEFRDIVEFKYDSFGWHGGQIVAVDYGS